METVKLDIDFDSPYRLAKELLTLANHECAIRLSSTKGTHLRIEGLSPSEAFSIRNRLDDSARFSLDIERKQKSNRATINVLWDKKNNHHSGIWIHWELHALAFWLLRDSGRTIRDCVQNLHSNFILYEYSEQISSLTYAELE